MACTTGSGASLPKPANSLQGVGRRGSSGPGSPCWEPMPPERARWCNGAPLPCTWLGAPAAADQQAAAGADRGCECYVHTLSCRFCRVHWLGSRCAACTTSCCRRRLSRLIRGESACTAGLAVVLRSGKQGGRTGTGGQLLQPWPAAVEGRKKGKHARPAIITTLHTEIIRTLWPTRPFKEKFQAMQALQRPT